MNLTRSRNGMIGGVCAGIARAVDIDVTIIRVAFILVSLFAGGGLLVLWAVIPREQGGTIAGEGYSKARNWYDDRNRKGPYAA
ncbi:MAG: PspC domain-containing protein [Propionibacteriaceae bacterium]|nr:PspC domain-containing protein [Propionibacteriaceae bacterium]